MLFLRIASAITTRYYGKYRWRHVWERMGNFIGYARVSTEDQDLSLQIDELKKAGCSKIFRDKVSGAKAERKGLDDCLNGLNEGDTLIVWRIDRLGRSLKHLVQVISDLKWMAQATLQGR